MINAGDIVFFTCVLVLIGVVGLVFWAAWRLLYETVVVGLRVAGRLPPRASQGRPPLPPRLAAEVRARVMARDGFECQKCGATDDLTVDHKIPKSKGGTNDEWNLWTLCRHCNSTKGVHVAA